ncbi:MAG TPA: glycoside hydrolase family 172 protein [Chitinophaga sp.]|uniref:glycoside hydrolase family 172 protein n=1 Tax=Chitinophaga sp. TaxID=1869181 RepID=UPI002DB8CAB0|nr:glycoside hydrolase family 172 protein [Chitinophaga sp.]HEU4552274.1 glycoside hydrolase family 172 protein [Chitinophaga sp.]
MVKKLLMLCCAVLAANLLYAQQPSFNGLDMNMGNLFQLSNAKTRSISPENFTGEKGKAGMATLEQGNARDAARDLGQGWKVNPYIHIEPGKTVTLAEIEGPGAIQHIWMTPTGNWRFSIIRFYWDDETTPSVEVPVGDFFGMGWGQYAQLTSLAICVNPGSAFNCYWTMPFRKKCKITMENINTERMTLYYQVDYTLTDVPADAGYFHAQFRRNNPTKGGLYTLVDGIKGKGHYVGTYLAWGVNNNGWWGEGEIKFFMDGDTKFPTICGTGTEDYFCGSYNFENRNTHQYQEFCTPYTGLAQVIRPNGVYDSQQRFGLYRWHIKDPVRFDKDLKVTIQDLGWRSGGRYLQQQSDISSVVYWYQAEPHAPFPALPPKNDLEVN